MVAWLLSDGQVLASLELAETFAAPRGDSSDDRPRRAPC